MINFGVYYTCYTETNAVEYAVDTLKSVYHDCPVYLVSDGGSDYSFLSERYSDVVTKREYDSRGFIPTISEETFRFPENQKLIKDSILTFMKRLNDAIDYCQTEIMLIMEPDVLVRNKLHYFPEKAHLLGSRINNGLSTGLRRIVATVPGSIDVNTWGATPALLRSSTFKKIHKFLLENEKILDKLIYSEHRLANYDVLLSVIFALVGAEEVFNPEIVECLRNPSWKTSHHPLVHQFREKYPRKSDGYTGRHAEEIS